MGPLNNFDPIFFYLKLGKSATSGGFDGVVTPSGKADLPCQGSYEPLRVLPSIGITCAPATSTIDSIQGQKHCSNTLGLMRSIDESKCIRTRDTSW